MANPVIQFQILSKAPEETERFYSSMFGWNVGDATAMGYRAIVTRTADGIQGGIWATAEALSATVLVPATALPDGDDIAILADPTGLSFGLMRARS